MSSQLDQISEAIGQLRAGQDASAAYLTRLELKLENAIAVLREGIEHSMQDIRQRHHDHNNEVMRQLGKMDLDIMNRFKDHEVRLQSLEQARAMQDGIGIANRKWVALISASFGGLAAAAVEFLVRYVK